MPRYELDDYVQEHVADDAVNANCVVSWRARTDVEGRVESLSVDLHNSFSFDSRQWSGRLPSSGGGVILRVSLQLGSWGLLAMAFGLLLLDAGSAYASRAHTGAGMFAATVALFECVGGDFVAGVLALAGGLRAGPSRESEY